MASFGNVTSGLETLSTQLERVISKAGETRGAIGETRRAAQDMSSDLAALEEQTDRAREQQEQVAEVVYRNTQALSALDGIYAAVMERGNNFSKDVQLQIELVRVGGQSLEQFLSIYGDAIIQLEDGMHRVRDLFSGADFDVYRDQLRQLIESVDEGGSKLGDVLAFLKQNASELTKGLQAMIEGFRRGEVSLERLLTLLRQIQQDFAGTDFGALAQALEQGLLAGDLA